ncbi:hypothetical protein Tco_0637013 [Tanacetum coccineum]
MASPRANGLLVKTSQIRSMVDNLANKLYGFNLPYLLKWKSWLGPIIVSWIVIKVIQLHHSIYTEASATTKQRLAGKELSNRLLAV